MIDDAYQRFSRALYSICYIGYFVMMSGIAYHLSCNVVVYTETAPILQRAYLASRKLLANVLGRRICPSFHECGCGHWFSFFYVARAFSMVAKAISHGFSLRRDDDDVDDFVNLNYHHTPRYIIASMPISRSLSKSASSSAIESRSRFMTGLALYRFHFPRHGMYFDFDKLDTEREYDDYYWDMNIIQEVIVSTILQ